MDDTTVFEDDPVTAATRWVEAGATRLHIVDLDGAASGQPVNVEIVHRIVEKYPRVPIEIGGLVDDLATRLLRAHVRRCPEDGSGTGLQIPLRGSEHRSLR